MAFMDNWENILIAFLVIIAVILIILEIIERKLHKKLINKRKDKNEEYLQKLRRINPIQKELALNKINNLAAGFFKETFKIKGTIEFLKLKNFFEEKNKLEEARFCEELEKKLFSGKEISHEEIKRLIATLAKIINKNHIYTKEEEIEIKEKKLKEKKKMRFLKKIKIFGVSDKKVKDKQKKSKKD